MNESDTRIPQEVMADRFIELANSLAKSEPIERVGAALMFAAARYNAFEIASKTDDLIKDRGDAQEWFSRQYAKMLDANIEEIMEMQA